MQKRLNLPAWLFGLGVLAQLVMVVLYGSVIWNQKTQPKAWALDSTEYYKQLYNQSDLNYFLYNSRNNHEERIRKYEKKRQATHRRIDSLSGSALQSEIDRTYNNRHPDKAGSKTNSANGSSGPPDSEGQSRPDHAARRGPIPAVVVIRPGESYYPTGENDYGVEPTPAGEGQRLATGSGASRRLPEETARSTVGELASSNRGRGVRRSQSQVNYDYWSLIRTQGYVYPDVAWAISAVETGYWWKEPPGHNLFGMKKSNQRRAFYVSLSGSGYCRYDNEHASLADYADYEQTVIRKYGLRSRRAYLAHIYKRFCPSPSYKGKVALALQKLTALV
jgi:hypothetical protein